MLGGPAKGWSKVVRWLLVVCIVVMTIAAFSAVDDGSGPVPTTRRRQSAQAIILLSGAVAIGTAIAAWCQFRCDR